MVGFSDVVGGASAGIAGCGAGIIDDIGLMFRLTHLGKTILHFFFPNVPPRCALGFFKHAPRAGEIAGPYAKFLERVTATIVRDAATTGTGDLEKVRPRISPRPYGAKGVHPPSRLINPILPR